MTSAELKAWWHDRLLVIHPDVGGDPDAFPRLLADYQARLVQALAVEGHCPICKGTGRVVEERGFNRLTLPCPQGCKKT